MVNNKLVLSINSIQRETDNSFITCSGGVILKTALLRSHEVAALVLSHLDVPRPGGGGGGGVDVQGEGHTGVTGWNPHVLASVVATDYRWWGEPGNTD